MKNHRNRTRAEDLAHASREQRELPARIAAVRAAKDAARASGRAGDLKPVDLARLVLPGDAA